MSNSNTSAAHRAWQAILDEWGDALKNDEPINGGDLVETIVRVNEVYQDETNSGDESPGG